MILAFPFALLLLLSSNVFASLRFFCFAFAMFFAQQFFASMSLPLVCSLCFFASRSLSLCFFALLFLLRSRFPYACFAFLFRFFLRDFSIRRLLGFRVRCAFPHFAFGFRFVFQLCNFSAFSLEPSVSDLFLKTSLSLFSLFQGGGFL